MENKKPFRISERIKSFGYALEGITAFFRTQHNAWIHLVAAIAAVVLGFILEIDNAEWCWLILAIAMVFITEMFNTALEFLTDLASPEIHPKAKMVKDIAAAAVLIASLGAVAIGAIIFLPKILLEF